ncbi:polysaccharide biosynthesis tyrosine autokinase [Vibrio sp. SM6]|uniref:non-specific protein-tyrosine kinase n=1 Tax=Vibrio agarilyticus TaxID=2726741 RepID=A0A7X8YGK7_9VIBR|nr:polysaccharide biosynthesis tyrosine autokinase [Vibrio agarilyticus]NLS12487.1 polysaccharide biosynthesis tyrosine autokinase [Vibrio agarilyticus]
MTLNTHSPQSQNERLAIGHYLSVIRARLLPISIFTILCTLLTLLIMLSAKPVYRATATILIDSNQKNAVSIEEVVGIDTTAKEYFQTQLEIIKSNRVAQRVIDKLNLAELPEFNPEPSQTSVFIGQLIGQIKSLLSNASYVAESTSEDIAPSTELNKAADEYKLLNAFKSAMSIVAVPKTQLVKISFESSDPVLAAKIANEIGNAFIENSLDSKVVATEQATSWINTRLQELKLKHQQSEKALLAFLQEQKLIDDSGIDALTSNELASLTERLSVATERRIASQSLYSALKVKNPELASIASLSQISNHPQITAIRLAEIEAEKRVSELSKRYGDKHDRMIQAKAQLASVQERAEIVITKLINGIKQELYSAQRQEALLRKELSAKKSEFQKLGIVKREYDSLKREVDSNAKLYDLFLTRQKETSATSDFTAANARFTDGALVPIEPAKPQKKRIIMIAFIASLFTAIVVALVLDSLRSTFNDNNDFEEKLGLVPLATLPKVKGRFGSNPLFNMEKGNIKLTRLYLEKVDSLRTTLLLNQRSDQYSNVIGVTSSLPDEGKTSTALQLARSFSKLEKVLLIDTDLRKPSIYLALNLPRSQAGITNFVHNDMSFEECIASAADTDFDVALSGIATASPQETLSHEKFKQFIELALEKYDRVIIDTPPSQLVSDSLIVGKLLGHMVMVVKAHSTKLNIVRDTIDQLHRHNITLDGVVLNNVSASLSSFHHKYHYSYYHEQTNAN